MTASFAAARGAGKDNPRAAPVVRGASARPAVANPLWQLLATGVQAKLAVSAPEDPAEAEADRVADRVMRMPDPAVQRKCAGCSDADSPCPTCEEEARIQRKPSRAAGAGEVASGFMGRLGAGAPLDSDSRAFFEPRFGRSFAHVRVH